MVGAGSLPVKAAAYAAANRRRLMYTGEAQLLSRSNTVHSKIQTEGITMAPQLLLPSCTLKYPNVSMITSKAVPS